MNFKVRRVVPEVSDWVLGFDRRNDTHAWPRLEDVDHHAA
jgi:hypothetical protein